MDFDDEQQYEAHKANSQPNPFFAQKQPIIEAKSVKQEEESLQPAKDEPIQSTLQRPKEIMKGLITLAVLRLLRKSKLVQDPEIVGRVISKFNCEQLQLQRQNKSQNTVFRVKGACMLVNKQFKYQPSMNTSHQSLFNFNKYAIPQDAQIQDCPSQTFRSQFIQVLAKGNSLGFQHLVVVYLIVLEFMEIKVRRLQGIDFSQARIHNKILLFDKVPAKKKKQKKISKRLQLDMLELDMQLHSHSSQQVWDLPKMPVWIQYLQEGTWTAFDPFTLQFEGGPQNYNPFYKYKLKEIQSVLVVSVEILKSLAPGRIFGEFVVRDQTPKYCASWATVEYNRKRLALKSFLNDLLRMSNFNGPFSAAHSWQRDAWNKQSKSLFDIRLHSIPRTEPQMRASQIFCIQQHLKANEQLQTWAKPLSDFQFKGEPVFYRKDVAVLKTRTGWNIEGRDVQLQTKPLKTLIQKKKNRQFFSYEQTIPFEIRRNQEGDFVLNEYGNIYDYEHLTLPPQLTFIPKRNYITIVCRKLKVRFAEMVSGFEMDQLMWHPVKSKVLVERKEVERIQQQYSKYMSEREQKKNEKLRKELLGIWRRLFKQQKIRQEMSLRYQAFD